MKEVVFMLGGEPAFECPGCGMYHQVHVNERNPHTGAIWKWNGDKVRPTFSPSINVKWSENGRVSICHSFVREGNIQFCPDSTHKLAGQTVPIPED